MSLLLIIRFYSYIYSVYAYALTCRHEYVCHSVYLFSLYPKCSFRIGYYPCLRSPDFKGSLLYEVTDIESSRSVKALPY